MITNPLGLTVVKIQHLFKKALSRKEQRRELKIILNEMINRELNHQALYIKTLEDKVLDFNQVKKLLK